MTVETKQKKTFHTLVLVAGLIIGAVGQAHFSEYYMMKGYILAKQQHGLVGSSEKPLSFEQGYFPLEENSEEVISVPAEALTPKSLQQ